jgi:hypothetical protein
MREAFVPPAAVGHRGEGGPLGLKGSLVSTRQDWKGWLAATGGLVLLDE